MKIAKQIHLDEEVVEVLTIRAVKEKPTLNYWLKKY